MQKDKLLKLRDIIVRNCKIIFPVVVVAVVAGTVTLALNMNQERSQGNESNSTEESSSVDDDMPDVIPEVPLLENTDSDIDALVTAYYTAKETGDMDTVRSLFDTVDENEMLYLQELSKYIDQYTEIQVYTQQGLTENSVIAYVYSRLRLIKYDAEFPGVEPLYITVNDQGEFYIKNALTDQELAYSNTVAGQSDVVDFRNRVEVDFNNLLTEQPQLAEYLIEVDYAVGISVGTTLAEQNVAANPEGQGTETDEGNGTETPDGGENTATPEPVVTPEYATATATVRVRSSDSEQADILGRVTEGTRLQVQQVGLNGWTKVIYEGGDGYIKSEFLEFSESAANLEVIGTVMATTNINIRSAASQSSERLGMLAGGETLDLLAVEGDWCKVVYNGQVAYVKAEFVQVQ